MILILCEKFDTPANSVISELKKRKANYEVIVGLDLLDTNFCVNVNSKSISFGRKTLADINITWYRKFINHKQAFSDDVDEQNYLKKEFDALASYFMISLPTKKWLNIPKYIKPYATKAQQLCTALEVGLEIPETIITNHRDNLRQFYNSNSHKIITKNLDNAFIFQKDNEAYATYTSSIFDYDIENQSTLFFPSIFQNEINKNIEIRAFYFLGKFYSYAMFSSGNMLTSTDYRIYDFKKPNRLMKYNLPKSLKIKLRMLMEKLDLDTGSIDIIKNENERYIFLEVNPQGQFGSMEKYGLNMEKDIAKFLIKNDK